MAFDIKFLSLQKTELIYEVEIRGEVPASKTADLRKQISKLCRTFPSEDILETPFDALTEITGVEASINKLQKNHDELRAKFDRNLFGRSQALCNHIYHRLNRIDCSTRPEALDKLTPLMAKFQNLQTYFLETVPPATSTAKVGMVESADEDGDVVPASSKVVVMCTKNFGELASLKYDGKSCARSFIQRVDEFVRARGIPSSKILSFATEIFTHEALHWFRAVQEQVSSWDELKVRLREDFGHADYDYRFLSEIRARTQGERENITIYLSVMAGMFSQLSKQLSEEEKLEILLHNIRPSYAPVLTCASEIRTIESLRVLCKNFENVQSRLSQFQEPPKASASTLAPEFAYLHSNSPDFPRSSSTNFSNPNKNFQRNSDSFRQQNFSNGPKPVHSVQVKNKFCPRCRVDSHGLRNCTAERKIVCFRCGRPDVKFYDCPSCQKPSSSQSKN